MAFPDVEGSVRISRNEIVKGKSSRTLFSRDLDGDGMGWDEGCK